MRKEEKAHLHNSSVSTDCVKMTRRSFLAASACSLAGLILPQSLKAAVGKTLSFYHTHTGEKMDILYTPGSYTGSVRHALEYFLRDFRTGDIHPIDPSLIDTLCAIQDCCSRQAPIEVISGYRSPKTNALLRKNGSGVAKKSLHMQGRAIDIRLTGVPTKMVRDLAVNLHNGGVGFYQKSDFVHIDTGRKRFW